VPARAFEQAGAGEGHPSPARGTLGRPPADFTGLLLFILVILNP